MKSDQSSSAAIRLTVLTVLERQTDRQTQTDRDRETETDRERESLHSCQLKLNKER